MLRTRLVRTPTITGLTRRMYSDYPGTVAQTQAFGKKEKAHEDQYAREKEKEELKKLRAQLQKMEEKVADLEKKNGEAEEKVKK